MNKRNNYSTEFKTKVVLEVLQKEATLNEIAARHDVSPVVISRWKSEFLERAADVFKKGPSEAERELGCGKGTGGSSGVQSRSVDICGRLAQKKI